MFIPKALAPGGTAKAKAQPAETQNWGLPYSVRRVRVRVSVVHACMCASVCTSIRVRAVHV